MGYVIYQMNELLYRRGSL